jgi:hypothetical protein
MIASTTVGNPEPRLGELVNKYRPAVLVASRTVGSRPRSVLPRGQGSSTRQLPQREAGEDQHR